VATDIAARGIDVDGITHVINYELPNVPESYVHRIGRTARAGATGVAISLCDTEERALLHDIERLMGRRVPVVGNPVGDRVGRLPGDGERPVQGRNRGQSDRGSARSGHSRPAGRGGHGGTGSGRAATTRGGSSSAATGRHRGAQEGTSSRKPYSGSGSSHSRHGSR